MNLNGIRLAVGVDCQKLATIVSLECHCSALVLQLGVRTPALTQLESLIIQYNLQNNTKQSVILIKYDN